MHPTQQVGNKCASMSHDEGPCVCTHDDDDDNDDHDDDDDDDDDDDG